MTRSRKRKLARECRSLRMGNTMAGSMIAAAAWSAVSPAYAQDEPASSGLEEVVVTAQKRAESLQDVPLSIQALGTQKLEQLNVQSFNDFAKFLPSVNFQSIGPGTAAVFMRGVASGENSNHSGPLPTVGIYLDEQPITTIQGSLDVHVYDMARIEALSGPQGTLYGASSQAGTIRYISNKPDPEAFDAAFGIQGNTVADGGQGYLAEGFVNLPISEKAAIRLVGWARKDAGYIDNVPGTITYPVSGITIDNNALVEDDFNDVETYGLRAALKIDLNDSWTITPAIMAQDQKARGSFSYNPAIGDLQVSRFQPEVFNDKWVQAALTVEGKFSNFDVVYAGAFLKRDTDGVSDYSDYSYFYDVNYSSGAYIYDNAGNVIDPTQYFLSNDGYKKQSHELRFSTNNPDSRWKAVGGLFMQRQQHDILQDYRINNLADDSAVTGYPDNIWLTNQVRIDRDYALFGEVSFDATSQLQLTAGARFFKAKNSLIGFWGYRSREAECAGPSSIGGGINGGPCINLDKEIDEDGQTYKLNATYRFDDERMVYATYSEGFRPGGINRRGSLPPFDADFLKNHEVGWKSTWLDRRLRFNGAIFLLKWDDIQFSYLGLNGLTEIRNAGKAEVTGLEVDVAWAASDRLSVSGGFALTDAKLKEDYCVDPSCVPVNAPSGTQLPVTPKFKGNITARYEFPLASFEAFAQGAVVYRGRNWADLQTVDRLALGPLDAFTVADFSFGIEKANYALELVVENAFDERGQETFTTQCAIVGYAGAGLTCGNRPYAVPNRPRLIGLKYTQKF
jgi:iron complex outermembrane receptor protein